MRPSFETVQQLVEIMERQRLEELAIETSELSVELRRDPNANPAVVIAAKETAQSPSHGRAIEAPMMGMFYRGPSPNDPPYVKEGDMVQEGQPICIIEAMKVFNELPSPCSGVITKIVAGNNSLVHAGEPLMYINEQP